MDLDARHKTLLENFRLNDGLKAMRILSENIASSDQIDELGKDIKGFIGAKSYEEALKGVPDGRVAIFNYCTKAESKEGHYGHWITIDNRNPDYIQYADPYGISPDGARKLMNLPEHDYFKQCLKISGKKILVNHVQFQDLVQYDDSCGIWALIFAKHPDLNSKMYKRHIPDEYYDFNLEMAFVDDLERKSGHKVTYKGHLKQFEKEI